MNRLKEFIRRCLAKPGARLKRRENVIIDASFMRRHDRVTAWTLAKAHNARFFIIHCEAPDDVIYSRLDARIKQSGDPSDGRWELFYKQKADFETVDLEEKEGYVKYIPSLDVNEVLTSVVRQVSFGIKIVSI